MKKLTSILSALVFGISCSTGFAQDHSQHQQGSTTDHSQHQAADGVDHMAHLDADMEEIRKTTDVAKRKEMLVHHLQMMREHMQHLTAMDHGAMGGNAGMQGMAPGTPAEGGGMQGMDHGAQGEGGGGMMQHHDKMVKVLQHMLETQEMILGLMDKK